MRDGPRAARHRTGGFMPAAGDDARAVRGRRVGRRANYHIGKFRGPKVFSSEKSWLLNKKHSVKTQLFYENTATRPSSWRARADRAHVCAFVAGVGKMQYRASCCSTHRAGFGLAFWCRSATSSPTPRSSRALRAGDLGDHFSSACCDGDRDRPRMLKPKPASPAADG